MEVRKNFYRVAGSYLPAFVLLGVLLRELSVFADESGGQNGISRYVLMMLVLHDQADSIEDAVHRYASSLADKALPDIPFHASPLINGKYAYESLDHETRHKMFSSFYVLVRNLPVSCKMFAYRRSDLSDTEAFTAKLR